MTGRAACFLLLLVGQGMIQGAMALSVDTTIDRNEVQPGESVIVTYTVDELVNDPDFTPLQEDFEILDQSRSQNITIINGQTNYEISWTLALMPRNSGDLSLPQIQFGDELSEAKPITVADDPAQTDELGDIHIGYSVDDPTPYVNQQVLLTTKIYAASTVENLEISDPEVVEGRATVDRLGRAREYHSVRGSRRYTVREQRYTLVPQSTGILTLSPIVIEASIGGAPVNRRSDPLELEVLQAGAPDASGKTTEIQARDLFLEIDVDKQAPYVQEQVLYTVRLFRAVAIENASMSPPSVSGGDAVIDRIGGDRRYQTTRENRRYAVTERRFVLFPQTSGALTIDPIRLEAAVALPHSGSNTTGFWNRPLAKPVRIESEAYELTVKTPPPDAPNPWLPAGKVTLEEQWPEPKVVEVGTPITRRIFLRAEQLLASQLPELDIPLPDTVKSYPERPQRRNDAGEGGVVGLLEQTLAVIPAEPGVITLPSFELDWWNTAANRKETLQVPARTFEVQAVATTTPAVPAAAVPASTDNTPASAPARNTDWWISTALGVGWLLTLALWWWDHRRAMVKPSEIRDHPVASRRHAEKQLKNACRAGDPNAARDALLLWARACWPERPPRSLAALGHTTSEDIAEEISKLQQALYAPTGEQWRGEALHQLVASFVLPDRRGAPGHGVLKPLHRH